MLMHHVHEHARYAPHPSTRNHEVLPAPVCSIAMLKPECSERPGACGPGGPVQSREEPPMPEPRPAAIYNWSDRPTDAPLPLLTRQRIIGEHAMISRVHLRKGCFVATHAHA